MSNEKFRELDRYDMAIQCKEWDDSKEENEPKLIPYDYETGEWVKYSDVEKLINTPKHETVEEWENRSGESYPDDAPVYFKERNKDSKGYWYFWKLSTYKQAIPYASVETLKKWMAGNKNNFVVANHHGKPPIDKED